MTGQGIVIADQEDGCPAAAGWVAYFDTLTLPLTGQELAEAQATLAGWDDPSSPQGGLGDCWGCRQRQPAPRPGRPGHPAQPSGRPR